VAGEAAVPAFDIPDGDEADEGIPEFWLTAMSNHEAIGGLVSDRDAEVLAHLRDVRWAPLLERLPPGWAAAALGPCCWRRRRSASAGSLARPRPRHCRQQQRPASAGALGARAGCCGSASAGTCGRGPLRPFRLLTLLLHILRPRSVATLTGESSGFKLSFHFAENPFFTNQVS
jgi:hypothetical protein